MAIQIDPVCGMEVDSDTARFTATHDGQTYYFCSRGCMLDFEEDPKKYLAEDHQPRGM